MPAAASPLPIDAFDSRFAQVNGVRLHYWIGGDPEGQPVVLWHGFLSTGYAWRSVAPVHSWTPGSPSSSPTCAAMATATSRRASMGYDARALAEEARGRWSPRSASAGGRLLGSRRP